MTVIIAHRALFNPDFVKDLRDEHEYGFGISEYNSVILLNLGAIILACSKDLLGMPSGKILAKPVP